MADGCEDEAGRSGSETANPESFQGQAGCLAIHRLGPPVVPFLTLFGGRVPRPKYTTEKG